MSLLSRSEIHIALSPERASAVRLSGGLRPRLANPKLVACKPASGRAAWAPAVDAMREALVPSALPRVRARVVLSNHFVRYVLLPWNAGVVTPEEEEAFARARFTHVYGTAASDWEIRLGGARPGAPQVASAVDRALIGGIGAVATQFSLDLRSVQPFLMAAFNAWRGEHARDGWLALAEPGRILLGRCERGRWRSLRARPFGGEARLAEIVEHERRLLGLPPARRVFAHAVDGVALDTAGLQTERLNPVKSPGVQRLAEGEFALALCGAV